MTDPLDPLRRAAKTLKSDYDAGAAEARARVDAHLASNSQSLKHADFLHVIARENSYVSWPAMKAAVELFGLDRAAKLQRLKIALAHGQPGVAERLLNDTPDLAEGHFGLLCALYDHAAVRQMLSDDPTQAFRPAGPVLPMVHLCRSPMFRVWPDRMKSAQGIAALLLRHGVDIDEGTVEHDAPLSPLFWALGHARNLSMAQWLLENGANPNDGESLYHATETRKAHAVRMLIDHGATPQGTNALPRAMDFDDAEMVEMLLEAGADPNEGGDGWTQGTGIEHGVPVLHQAARRMNSGQVLDLLFDHGADPTALWQGHSAYAFARVYGNAALAQRLDARGADTTLTPDEEMLAQAATGQAPEGFIDPAKLPETYRNILREILHLPGKLPHLKALVAIGLEWDRPDAEGLTPVQAAGWNGLPDVLAYFLKLGPDLSHVNGYGGTLLSTIIHGSENNPDQTRSDYVACLNQVLEHGVALPRRAIELAGRDDIRTFLGHWAAAKPGQVVAHGIA